MRVADDVAKRLPVKSFTFYFRGRPGTGGFRITGCFGNRGEVTPPPSRGLPILGTKVPKNIFGAGSENLDRQRKQLIE